MSLTTVRLMFTHMIILLITLTYSIQVFAIGGVGPLEATPDGVRNERPAVMDQIGIDENLGQSLDPNLSFINDKGEAVKIGSFFGGLPVVMLLIYYECPTLCNVHLNSLVGQLREFEWKSGDKFQLVAVSIDPKEDYKVAAAKKKNYLKLYGDESVADSWHFLTGEEGQIKKLASQVGFKYAWDSNMNQWAHGAASYVITPEGKISYYHYGITFNPKVMRLSLVEASDNKIGTVVDKLILYCLQYDPNKKTYAFYAYNIMKVAAFLTFLILAIFLFRFWRQERALKTKG